MAYWNDKDRSSYDVRLRNGGISTDLPRIDYTTVFDTPAVRQWPAGTMLSSPPPVMSPPATRNTTGLVRAVALLAITAAVVWLAEPHEHDTTGPEEE